MRLKVKIGDKIQDSSDRNRYGTIEKAIRSSGQATVKWNTGLHTTISTARIHALPGRKTGYLLLPPGWQPMPELAAMADASADVDAAELRKETQARATESEAGVTSDKLDHEPTGHGY